jgi:hypothetical protein
MRHVLEPEHLTPWKEVRSVDIYTTNVAAARLGAACLGVATARSPWATLAVVGAEHALPATAVLAVDRPGANRVAHRRIPASTQHFTQMSSGLLPVGNGTRKQTNVQKTRINAGGYGAMGPHPEREQPA